MKNIYKFCLCGVFFLFAIFTYGDIYDVTDYYQVGDTSYAEAIGRAITAADNNSGGVIYFPPGTYQVHQTIYAKKNLTFEGNSGPGGSSIIQATGQSAFNLFCCFNSNASNVVFKNLVIDLNDLSSGGDTVGIGIYIHSDTGFNGADSVTGVRIEDCEIKNGSSHGIRGYHTSWDYSIPFEIRIKNCKIHDCLRRGIMTQLGTNVIISGTEIYGCDDGGIIMNYGTNQIIKSCSIHDNGDGTNNNAIEMQRINNWKIIDNTIKGNAGLGIAALLRVKNFIISNNILDANENGNIKVAPSSDSVTVYDVHGVIADNVCSGYTGKKGIEARLVNNLVISGNVCKDNTSSSGIYIFGRHCVVNNNIISGNSYGVYFYTTSSFNEDPLGYHEVNQNSFCDNTNDVYITSGVESVNSTLTEDLTQ